MLKDMATSVLNDIRHLCFTKPIWKEFFNTFSNKPDFKGISYRGEIMADMSRPEDNLTFKVARWTKVTAILKHLHDNGVGILESKKGRGPQTSFRWCYDPRLINDAINNPNDSHIIPPIAYDPFSEKKLPPGVVLHGGGSRRENTDYGAAISDLRVEFAALTKTVQEVISQSRASGVTVTFTINGRLTKQEAEFWAERISLLGE